MQHRHAPISLVLAALLGMGAASLIAKQPPIELIEIDPPLPAYLAPEEAHLPLPAVEFDRLAPTGFLRTPAEYEPQDGLLFSWASTFEGPLSSMIAYTTTGNPGGMAWVIVPTLTSAQTTAAKLIVAGADMERVEFIIRSQNSVWVRDYGPRFIQQDGQRAIVDHTYNRPRPLDNELPAFLSVSWGEPRYALPLVHGGGNFHLFSNGDALLTGLILNENSASTATDVTIAFGDYEGLDVTIVEPFPTSVDATQHIDMWLLPIGDGKVIINEYMGMDSYPPRRITNQVAASLEARGYIVYRVPAWNSGPGGYGGTHYTYTNAILLNDQVMIPWYNDPRDAQALAVFAAAMPGKTIRQIDCRHIINFAGALHCVAMHVPTLLFPNEPRIRIQSPRTGDLLIGGERRVVAWTAYDPDGISHVQIRLSVDGGESFPYTVTAHAPNTGRFEWTVPRVSADDCRLLVRAYDTQGHVGTTVSRGSFRIAPRAPEQVHTFWFDTDPGWTRTGQWQFGTPIGQGGGTFGSPDPAAGFTGTRVMGVNLAGDYSTTPGGPYHLTTGPVDLRGISGATLRFQRWLNTDRRPYAEAAIEVSIDGVNWSIIWANGTSPITQSQWTLATYVLPAWTDQQQSVYVRWSYRINNGALAGSGWNIDDIEIWGVASTNPYLCPGDMNCDGYVTFADISLFVTALRTLDPSTWPDHDPESGICPYNNGDFNGDGVVSFADITPFITAIKNTDPVPCVTAP